MAGDQEREEHRRQLEAVAGDPKATLLWAFERAKEYFSSNEADEKAPPVSKDASVDERLRDGSSSLSVQRVGRNDPCPCGSGKKYKKCCLRK